MSLPAGFYLEWRARHEESLLLREAGLPQPAERTLQSIWRHQHLRRDDLRALDGRPVRVLHPGFWNKSAGPDFNGAVIQIGSEPPRSGDVEIDLEASGWRAHAHASNPSYAHVILHVLWRGPADKTVPCPALALEPHLDSSLAELQSWAESSAVDDWPHEFRGACAAPLRDLPADKTAGLLRQAALTRLQRKAREFEIRAGQAGWDQALWEGLFRALGYKQNIWPMQRLAELRSRICEDGPSRNARARLLQARLLGVGGLLRDEPAERGSYLRALWDDWWRDRGRFDDVILPKAAWRFHGLRPANQPQRRLALAAHWLCAPRLLPNLQNWFDTPETASPSTLLACLQPPDDDHWIWHWGLSTGRLAKPQPLLGESRVSDLALNVVLPWFWARGSTDNQSGWRPRAEKLYLTWPAAQDNAVLRLARQRLFGQPAPCWLNTAAAQQGLLQIVRDFCQHTNALCANCLFPDLARALTVENKVANTNEMS